MWLELEREGEECDKREIVRMGRVLLGVCLCMYLRATGSMPYAMLGLTG
jgi:hypothetical protein